MTEQKQETKTEEIRVDLFRVLVETLKTVNPEEFNMNFFWRVNVETNQACGCMVYHGSFHPLIAQRMEEVECKWVETGNKNNEEYKYFSPLCQPAA